MFSSKINCEKKYKFLLNSKIFPLTFYQNEHKLFVNKTQKDFFNFKTLLDLILHYMEKKITNI